MSLLPVRRIMRRDFLTVAPGETLGGAYQLMRFARLRHLLVEENGVLVGILSYRDLLEAFLATSEQRPGSARPDDTVASAMRPKPYAITPDTLLRDAATRLCSLRLGCLPVVDRSEGPASLVGIVTEADLLQAVFQQG